MQIINNNVSAFLSKVDMNNDGPDNIKPIHVVVKKAVIQALHGHQLQLAKILVQMGRCLWEAYK